MAGTGSGYIYRPPQRYDGIILQVQKQGLRCKLSVFTRQEGIISVFLPRRSRSRQGSGALMGLSRITFDAVWQGQAAMLREYECRGNAAMLELTWERYVYSQVFVEMTCCLLPYRQPDDAVYELLLQYSQALSVKDPRILTITAGWQLCSLAGFYPDTGRIQVWYAGKRDGRSVYYLADDGAPSPMPSVPIPLAVRTLWQTLLDYPWGKDETLRLSANGLAFLERLLYSYVEQCSESTLQSVAALRLS